MPFRLAIACAVASTLLAVTPAPSHAASTLNTVMDQGFLRCGVTLEGGSSMTTLTPAGEWQGFYVEFCRAVAAAVTGEAENVEYIRVATSTRFDLLRDGTLDLLSEMTTWTLGRDLAGMDFAGPVFHDGQGFMVYVGDGIDHIDQLDGQTVCVPEEATSSANLEDLALNTGLNLIPMPFSTLEGVFYAFFERQCRAVSTDAMILGSVRLSLAANPEDYKILPTRISHEPIGLAVREGDAPWREVVNWVVFAMIEAEDLGINSRNIESMASSDRVEVRRFLGQEETSLAPHGLPADWAYQVIRQVGNYGEVYDRSFGPETPFNMPRGLNALIKDGGVLWAPPLR